MAAVILVVFGIAIFGLPLTEGSAKLYPFNLLNKDDLYSGCYGLRRVFMSTIIEGR